MPDYDSGYKLLFSHPQMVKDLLLGFVREDWVHKLDFDSLEKVNASYVSDDFKKRHDDIVWKVRFADEWLYVYLILEFQASEDPFMAVRMMTYLGLLYQDLIKSKQLTTTGKLPPVLPLVLYNGEPRWKAPTEVSELVELIPGHLSNYSPKLKYLLIDEGAYEHTDLESLKNLVSTLFQLEKAPASEIADELILRLIEWLWDNKELQRSFAVFINRVYFRNKVDVSEIFHRAKTPSEAKTMLQKNREKWDQELIHKSKAEGKAEGVKEGRVQVAKRLLAVGMTVSKTAELTDLTEDEVQNLQDSINSQKH